MVAKQRRTMFPPINPTLLRETVDKVDKCMARLQELQYTIAGGSKMVYGVSLSPRSTKGYLKTSLRCKQESIRIKNANPRKSPPGKMPTPTGEWRRMSLPAMLVGETVGEILKASQFARDIVVAAAPPNNRKPSSDDPKTPVTVRRIHRVNINNENSELRTRRRKEKQVKAICKESPSPVLRRARSKISFKASSPIHLQEKDNIRYMANRVSPRHKPWARKAVLFPNPLFHSSPTSTNPRFCKTKSPIITRNRPKTPHKFLIKTRSPPSSSKFPVKIRGSPPPVLISSSRLRRSPIKASSSTIGAAARLRRSFSPSRLANRLISPLKARKSFQHKTDGLLKHNFNCTPIRLRPRQPPPVLISPSRLRRSPIKASSTIGAAARLRRSFSPSRLANRLISPLKARKSFQHKTDGLLKHNFNCTPIRLRPRQM